MIEPPWSLHPQLEQDTEAVGDLPLARLLVKNDANYPWLLLVPRRPGVREIIDLDEKDQAQLMIEIAQTSRALKEVTACHKLNVAAIGNVVLQLHIHIVARERDDPAWPKPVWVRCRRGRTISPHAKRSSPHCGANSESNDAATASLARSLAISARASRLARAERSTTTLRQRAKPPAPAGCRRPRPATRP